MAVCSRGCVGFLRKRKLDLLPTPRARPKKKLEKTDAEEAPGCPPMSELGQLGQPATRACDPFGLWSLDTEFQEPFASFSCGVSFEALPKIECEETGGK